MRRSEYHKLDGTYAKLLAGVINRAGTAPAKRANQIKITLMIKS